MTQLHPDQIPAVEAIVFTDRGIVKAPAGSGKTIIAAAAVDDWRKSHPHNTPQVLWLANTLEQCEQAKEACWQFGLQFTLNLEIACYQSGKSAVGYDLVILDECHHIPAEEFRKCLDGYNGPRWGFTATDKREDELADDVYTLIGPVVYEVPREPLIAAGRIVPAKVYFLTPNEPDEMEDQIEEEAKDGAEKMKSAVNFVAVQMLGKSVEQVARISSAYEAALAMCDKYSYEIEGPVNRLKDLASARMDGDADVIRGWLTAAAKKEILSRARWHSCQGTGIFENEKRNAAIVAKADEHMEDSVLILVGSIEHGEQLHKSIPGSQVIHSKMGAKNRRESIERFRNGSLPVAIATSLADEGLDVPRANVLILAAAGRSDAKSEQRTGRVLRSWGDKSHGTIYDFWDWQHPLLFNQSRARAKVYHRLKYEFVGAERVLPIVLKSLGIKIHPAIGMEKKNEERGCINPTPKPYSGPLTNTPALNTNETTTTPTSVGLQQPAGPTQTSDNPAAVPPSVPSSHATRAHSRLSSSPVDAVQGPSEKARVSQSLQSQVVLKKQSSDREVSGELVSEKPKARTVQEQRVVSAQPEKDEGAFGIEQGGNPSGGVELQSREPVCLRGDGPVLSGLPSPRGREETRSNFKSVSGGQSESGDERDSKVHSDVCELPSKAPLLAHSERKHSRLSPSTLKGKAICSGFVSDPDGDKTAANRGTLGHEGVEKRNPDLAGKDEQLRAGILKCIAYEDRVRSKFGPGTKEFKEIRLYYFDQWGHADLILIDGKRAALIDWKFAYNWYEADAPQFWAYCKGVWDKWTQVEEIEVHVGHPFLNATDVETFTRKEHYEKFSVGIKAVQAKVVQNNPEHYRITDQCRYCGFAGKCVKLAELGYKIGRSYMPEIVVPDINFHGSQVTGGDVMSALLKLAPIIKKAAGGWTKAGLEMYDNGTEIPGFKIVNKSGARSIVSAKAAYQIIKQYFIPDLTPEAFLTHCDVSVTGADQLVSDATAKGSKGKPGKADAVKLFKAYLEDADALTTGGGSRYLMAEKETAEE